MELPLDDKQWALQKTVRDWVDKVVAPAAMEADRNEKLPDDALTGLRDLGLLGLTIPEHYDGGEADPLSYVLTVEELARGDANVRSILSVHLGLVAAPILRW